MDLLGGALGVSCQGIMMTLEEILQSCSQETTGGAVILLLGNMESPFWVHSLADKKKLEISSDGNFRITFLDVGKSTGMES